MKHIINKNDIPEHVSRVTEILKNAGFEAYIVGGCVRDLVMNKRPKDWDITTDATPESIISLYEGVFKVVYENSFGTVAIIDEAQPTSSNIRQVEITPYRTESIYSDHRHPDKVSFSKKIEDDLKRRDFTVNALAYDIQNDILIDNFNGINDISQKMIRCVGNPEERFSEDALRIMRAIRFSAQLGFSVSHETITSMFHVKHLISVVSTERIRDEFTKMIDSDSPSLAIGLMRQLDILKLVIPELEEGIGCEQGGAHKYDVFDHLVYACQHAADKGFSFHVKLAALFHDIGKPRTRRPGNKKAYTFYGHEVVGARMTKKILERLKFSKNDIELVTKLVRYHMFFSDTEQITLSAVRRMISNVSRENIWLLMDVRECDRVGMNKTEAPYRLRKYHAMIEQCLRDPISVGQLKIDGNYLANELHVKPGPRMGWILHGLLELVLENPEVNTIENLTFHVKQFEKLSDSELKTIGERARREKERLEQEEVEQLHLKHGVGKKN